MTMRVLDAQALAGLADVPLLIDPIERAIRDTTTPQPLRQVMNAGEGRFGVMPGICEPAGLFGAKLLCVDPALRARGLLSHQGVLVVFDLDTGLPCGVLEAGVVTGLRTAAASAVATRILSRPEAKTLAILGAGHQAGLHIAAIRAVRPIEHVKVWARDPTKARQFAAAHGAVACPDVATACDGADIICTLTGARAPILLGRDLSPGQHVNAVGASTADERELDETAVARGRFFADSVAGVQAQGGEYRAALAAGAVTDGHILGALGQVLRGDVAGRTRDSDITIYKSLGSIIQDLAAGRFLLAAAMQAGAGLSLSFAAPDGRPTPGGS